jgi:hypothetical protein
MAKYFSVSKSNKRSVLFVGKKRIVGIEAFAKKAKTAKFNLYAQFNIEMIGCQ